MAFSLFTKVIKENKYILSSDTLDQIVLAVEDYAKSKKIDALSAKRYGFMIDDALFRLMRKGWEGKEISVIFGMKDFTPDVSIECVGESTPPYPKDTKKYGVMQNDFLLSSGQQVEYQYADGVNILHLFLKRPRNVIKEIVIVDLIAIVLGILGKVLLPDDFLSALLSGFISPFISMFFRLLSCIAAPMVFLSVIIGICGMGDSHIFGRIGKSVILFCLGMTFLGAVIGGLFFPFLGGSLSESGNFGSQISSLLDMILNVVPSSIVSPFVDGNTLQIIFLALATGITMTVLSHKVKGIISAVNQFYHIIIYLMNMVSRMVPFVVFFLVIQMIWNDTYLLFVSTWRFFLIMVSGFALVSLIICILTSIYQKASLWKVIKSNIGSFIIAFTTASSSATFSNNMKVSKDDYGVDADFAGFSIPFGLIMHNPVAACYDMIVLGYFAVSYNVSTSFGWLLIAMFVSSVVCISSPPVPGGAAVSYTLLFAQMGIPTEALAVVLVMDVLTDFFVTSFKCFILPISMSNIAKHLGYKSSKGTISKKENTNSHAS